jgi:hypothetical protein
LSYQNPYPPNYGMPPAPPPRKKNRAGAIVIVVILFVAILCLGAVGVGIYAVRSWVTDVGNGLSAQNEDTLAIGECATLWYEDPSDDDSDAHLRRVSSCTSGTYKVVARHGGTTDRSTCRDDGSDKTYASLPGGDSPTYVLCLKRQ